MTVALPIARVALDVPLPEPFDYRVGVGQDVATGDWVVVPWGRGRRVGLVLERVAGTEVPEDRLRPVEGRLPDLPRAADHWLALVAFAARYYHTGLGELALPSVPKLFRSPPTQRSRGSPVTRARARFDGEGMPPEAAAPIEPPPLTDEQAQALHGLEAVDGHAVTVLHGITGSGKTEVYFRWIDRLLDRDGRRQALLLVPEIALTPQLAARIRARFPAHALAVLHSDMPDADRAAHWLAAAEGRARIVLGTRLAVLAPLPALAAIVVDEEHDASYKQQEGARWSARDLAIALGAQRGVPVVLGSATPSMETWHAVRRGRYRLATLAARASGTPLPTVQRVSLVRATVRHGLTDLAVEAIAAAIARGEQALVYLNRRGYAPVLACNACGWLSRCDHCDAYRVLHRVGPRYRLICHHCGADRPVPRTCPACGNVDLAGLGRGTQRLEEGLQDLFPAARIGRLDRDVARRRGGAAAVLDAAHAGELDLLVGTQMLAKGHDFRRLTLVVVVDADAGLFAADFRAPERLFATLMQVAGRAGRHHADSRVLLQTRYPEHPAYEALARHDYASFAERQLAEREQARLPPFTHQALLTAHAPAMDAAAGFLAEARALLVDSAALGLPAAVWAALNVCDPVPMPLAQARGEARAQMLVESASRPALHAALGPWLAALRARRAPVRWQLVVDPLEI